MRLETWLAAFATLVFLSAVLAACPETESENWPCNRDVDCKNTEICQNGLCTIGTRINDAAFDVGGSDLHSDLFVAIDSSQASDGAALDGGGDDCVDDDVHHVDIVAIDGLVTDLVQMDNLSDVNVSDARLRDLRINDVAELDTLSTDTLQILDTTVADQNRADRASVDDSPISDSSVNPDTILPDIAGIDIEAVHVEIWGDAPQSMYPGTVQDTYINLDNEKNSTSEQLNLYTWPAQTVANAIIIKWDLSALPASAVVIGAVVGLTVKEGNTSTYTSSVHAIVNVNPNIVNCTGFNYDNVHAWTANSCCYDDVPLAQADIAPAESTTLLDGNDDEYLWEVTDMVQAWVRSPGSNRGMLINSDATAVSEDHYFFYSSEAPEPELRPWLGIAYMLGGID